MLSSLTLHHDILRLKTEYGRRTVLASKGYKVSPKGVSTGSDLNLTKVKKHGKQSQKDLSWIIQEIECLKRKISAFFK